MTPPLGRIAGRRLILLLKLLGLVARRFGLSGRYHRLMERLTRETGLFDPDWYLQQNPDVAASGMDPLTHFVLYGDREGRSPLRLFEPGHYRSHVTPKSPKIVNSLVHYAWVGRYSGGSTSAWFDSGYYLLNNRDVKYARVDPLLHFLHYGWSEGRQPAADFDRMRFLRTLPEFDPAAAAAERANQPLPHASLPTDEEWQVLTPPKSGGAQVDVIVPVYGGYEETLRCIHSMLSFAQETPYELVVIYDQGPDPALAEALKSLASRGLFTYLENTENQGFVRTVNRGMRLHPARDVVLLNADAQPFNNWLDRLRATAYRADRVASVTPLSNNATICSYPQFNRDNPFAIEINGAQVDKLAAQVNAGESVPAPTGVGFCMYIRRAALDAVGLFDEEAFGLGYGEENDFCQRAIRAGWQNLLSLDTYVWHWGSTSFGGSRHQRILSALRVLGSRYPRYQQDVEHFIAADPLRAARGRLDEARLELLRRERNVLILTHSRGGGTERYISETVERLQAEGAGVFFLRSDPQGRGTLSTPEIPVLPNLQPITFDSDAPLIDLLKKIGIHEVHVHQLVDFSPKVFAVVGQAVRQLPDVRLQVFVHDYLMICPRINLIDASEVYCGEPGEGRCNACLQQQPVPKDLREFDIVRWRQRSRVLCEAAETVVVPDDDVVGRLQRYFPNANFSVRPHEPQVSAVNETTPGLRNDEPLSVVVVGAIGNIKGYEVLKAAARDARQRNLPIAYAVLGYTRNDSEIREAGVEVIGRYRDAELPQLLGSRAPHVVWLPSVWPETYCYTLTPALVAGLPVAAFDLGAIARRVRTQADSSLLMPLAWAASPALINDRFMTYRAGLLIAGTSDTNSQRRETV